MNFWEFVNKIGDAILWALALGLAAVIGAMAVLHILGGPQ